VHWNHIGAVFFVKLINLGADVECMRTQSLELASDCAAVATLSLLLGVRL